MRTLWHDRVLRAVCTATLLCNIGMGALIATLVLHVTGWLHAGNAGFAAAMTAYSAGSLAGECRPSGSRAGSGGYGACSCADASRRRPWYSSAPSATWVHSSRAWHCSD